MLLLLPWYYGIGYNIIIYYTRIQIWYLTCNNSGCIYRVDIYTRVVSHVCIDKTDHFFQDSEGGTEAMSYH